MDLKKEIAKLIKLQKIDLEINYLIDQKEIEIPRKIEELKNNFLEEKKRLEINEKKIKDLHLKQKNKELDIVAKEEALKKAQTQLYQLKTNKEYQAKLVEIGSIKADISILEEELLKIFDEIEVANKELNDEKQKFLEEEKKFKLEEEKINSYIKEIDIKIKSLKEKREIFIKDIDQNILKKYEDLLKKRSGIALAEINNESCGACHMRITPQTINEIKMYRDLILCENCVRILYIPEEIIIDG